MFAKPVYPFRMPGNVIFGLNALNRLQDEVKSFGAQKVLLITDPQIAATPMPEKIADLLKGAGVPCAVYGEARPEPPASSIQACADMIRGDNFDLLIGLGGGSAMDVTKGGSVVAANGGKLTDYYGIEKVPRRGLPMIMIPTTSGTGAEMTMNAVFVDDATRTKMTVQSRFIMPDVALVDPELTISCPAKLTASTGLDALAHAIESYTAQKATIMTDMFALKAIGLIGKWLRTAVYDRGNIEARYYMSSGSMLAGVCLANSGVNAVHALAHSLGGRFAVPHGVANGLLLPYVMEYNFLGDVSKFAGIAEAMGIDVSCMTEREAAEESIRVVAELCEDVGCPRKIELLGVGKEGLPELVQGAMNNTRSMSNNPRELSAEDVLAIFNNAY